MRGCNRWLTNFKPQLVVVNWKICYDNSIEDVRRKSIDTPPCGRKENTMILAEKIALLRRQNGWSQEELADQLNVSRQAVSKWEGGTSIPDLDKILKLSALFEVSTDYLLKDELEQPGATAPLPKEERVTEPCRTVSFDEANAYLSTVQAVHGKMAAGVGLCILSPIALLVLGAWSDGTPSEERMAGLGVIFLLLFVALGLLLILPAAIRLEAFEYLEKEQIALAYGVEGIVERQKQEYAPTYRRSMTQGVVLCVLAVVPILGTAMLGAPGFWVAAAVGLLLAIVAGAVQLFIRAGMTQGSFDKLLQTGEYTVREKWTNRRVGWFAGAYWCLVTAVYLAVSFWNNNWEKSWIIWAVAGLVFAALYSAVRAWADRKNQ